ncbi:hypothetical protein [Streptomyces poriferorum]|uniref:Transporter n=1 Tax=Streptomyces poriferorum TaxID=2798799 RepID=A0ABY9IUV5_9ACTN|nr:MULTISPECIES: hypothetical protein [unclassified Streptomyces]MDP5313566.1 hypothetical protein [Streptomyces sp. Alt4]WLQ57466.1 hypothetical protein P8A19_19300 [Streptomyces sp. Alt2]
MSTITTTTPPRSAPSGLALRAGARVLLRQHRAALQIAGALALAGIVVLVGFALRAAQVAETFAADPCSAANVGLECSQPVRNYLDSMSQFSTVLGYGGLALIVLPGLIAAFVAGPMIAREFESGTYRVSWTQSVSPAHWFVAKLAVPAVVLLAGVSVLTGVYAWSRSQSSTEYPVNWYERPVFGALGTMPVAYALLGLALGALTGLLIHRTVPAMAVAVLATGAVAVTLTTVRSALWPLRTAINTASAGNGVDADSWVLGTGRITADGSRLPMETCWQRPHAEEVRCLADHHVTGFWVDHHPASHFWPLQLVETGIVLVLAAAAVALAFRVLRRRHA